MGASFGQFIPVRIGDDDEEVVFRRKAVLNFDLIRSNLSSLASGIGAALAAAGGPSFANPTASVGLTAVNGTAVTAMRSDAAPPIDQAIAPTWTGTHTFRKSGIATTSTDAIALDNATAATALSTKQFSPRLRFLGRYWDGAASAVSEFIAENQTNDAEPFGSLVVSRRLGGSGSYTEALRIDSRGRVGINNSSPNDLLHVVGGPINQQTNSIGVTSTDGVNIFNTTAAAAGAQQWSPRIRLTGQGWKTDATAASQTVDWILENRPVQGAANPSTLLVFSNQINSGGYAAVMALDSLGTGRVGIGTTTPLYELHAKKAISGDNVVIAVENTDTGGLSGAMVSIIGTSSSTGDARIFMSADGGTTYYNITVDRSDSNKLKFSVSDSPGESAAMTIAQDTFIGMGTAMTAPQEILHLGADAHVALMIQRSETGTGQPNLVFYKTRGDTVTPSTVVDEDNLGRIEWRTHSGTAEQLSAYIDAHVDNTVTATQVPAARLNFYTSAGNAAPSNRMVINRLGNLGVGDAAVSADPTENIDFGFSATSGATGVIRCTSTGAGDALWEAQVSATGSGDPWFLLSVNTVKDVYLAIDNSDSDKFKIGDGTTVGSTVTMTMITATGEVGIGTTAPDSGRKLHVTHATSGTSTVHFANTADTTSAHVLKITGGDNASAGADLISFFRPDGTNLGEIEQAGATTVSYSTSSDRRIKTAFADRIYGSQTLRDLQTREFFFNEDGPARRRLGFFAQEVFLVYPQAVRRPHPNGGDSPKTNPWGMEYGALTPLLVKGWQEHDARIAALEAKVLV